MTSAFLVFAVFVVLATVALLIIVTSIPEEDGIC